MLQSSLVHPASHAQLSLRHVPRPEQFAGHAGTTASCKAQSGPTKPRWHMHDPPLQIPWPEQLSRHSCVRILSEHTQVPLGSTVAPPYEQCASHGSPALSATSGTVSEQEPPYHPASQMHQPTAQVPCPEQPPSQSSSPGGKPQAGPVQPLSQTQVEF